MALPRSCIYRRQSGMIGALERLSIQELLTAVSPIADDAIATLQRTIERLHDVAERLDLLRVSRTRRAPTD